VLKFDQL